MANCSQAAIMFPIDLEVVRQNSLPMWALNSNWLQINTLSTSKALLYLTVKGLMLISCQQLHSNLSLNEYTLSICSKFTSLNIDISRHFSHSDDFLVMEICQKIPKIKCPSVPESQSTACYHSTIFISLKV